jgi:hypothetical protein
MILFQRLRGVAALHLREQDEAARAAEQARVLGDLGDVGGLGHRPERSILGRLAPVHRILGAQPPPCVVGIPVLGVESSGDHVEMVQGNAVRVRKRCVGHAASLRPWGAEDIKRELA